MGGSGDGRGCFSTGNHPKSGRFPVNNLSKAPAIQTAGRSRAMTTQKKANEPIAQIKPVDNLPFGGTMNPGLWNKNSRFKRLGEAEADGGRRVGKGGYGIVFIGFDELRQERVAIKRQEADTAAAAREAATYTMLEAFPHQNLLRMHAMWTAVMLNTTYLYMAMELCTTSLWRCVCWGNPEQRPEWLTTEKTTNILLGVLRGGGFLHERGVVHGDLSMSNILITPDKLEVKIADFGAVTAHGWLAQDKLCVAYIRPPERIMGSLLITAAVDAWAVSINALALYTSQVPTATYTVDNQDDDHRTRHVLEAALQLLPTITEATWAGHSGLPLWEKHAPQVNRCASTNGLQAFVTKCYVYKADDEGPQKAVSFIAHGLKWDPISRPTMHEMEKNLLCLSGNGCQPTDETKNHGVKQGTVHQEEHQAQGKSGQHVQGENSQQVEKTATSASTKPAQRGQMLQEEPKANGNSSKRTDAIAEQTCGCSGNCGMQPCEKRSNRRRSDKNIKICTRKVHAGESLCRGCQCERMGCTNPKSKITKRWCQKHGKELMNQQFATHTSHGNFPSAANSLEFKVLLRTNYLHTYLNPDDNVAWQEVCQEFCTPQVGNLMVPEGVVACVLAHSIKWPCAQRKYLTFLRNRAQAAGLTAASLAGAYREVLQWADGKTMQAMHKVLSVAGRAHAQTGLAITATQLGFVSNNPDTCKEATVLHLGPNGKEYYLKPEGMTTSTEAIIEKYINAAQVANLRWPDAHTTLPQFASDVFDLMVKCHSEKVEGAGLIGGGVAAQRAHKGMPKRGVSDPGEPDHSGCQPKPGYTLQHVTRHFLIAADTLGIFNFDGLHYRDIASYLPDMTGQAECVRDWSLLFMKEECGLDPFFISCNLCFAHTLTKEEKHAVLTTPYCELYKPIGDAIVNQSDDESEPPNFFAFCRAVASRSTPAGHTSNTTKGDNRPDPPSSKRKRKDSDT